MNSFDIFTLFGLLHIGGCKVTAWLFEAWANKDIQEKVYIVGIMNLKKPSLLYACCKTIQELFFCRFKRIKWISLNITASVPAAAVCKIALTKFLISLWQKRSTKLVGNRECVFGLAVGRCCKTCPVQRACPVGVSLTGITTPCCYFITAETEVYRFSPADMNHLNQQIQEEIYDEMLFKRAS